MLILSLLILIHFATANSLLSITHPNNALIIRKFMVARQSPTDTGDTVPDACKTDCDPINARIVQGCSPQDCCQSNFVNEYFQCLKCVGGARNATDFTRAQLTLDDLTVQCDSRGLNVPKLTLPGQDVNRILPSAPATAITAGIPVFTSVTAPLPTISASAQSSNTPTPSSAGAGYLIPHLSHVQAIVVLLGGFIHLALWMPSAHLSSFLFSVWMTIKIGTLMNITLMVYGTNRTSFRHELPSAFSWLLA